jgi:ABC-type glycerol-3-phosphate transport system substrate-binding protein
LKIKIIKILAITFGAILLWLIVFLIRNEPRNTAPKTTLEFWTVFDKSEDLKPLLNNFKNKTGIQINFRSFTDLTEYQDTLLFELAAGEGPDIFAVHNFWLPKYRDLITPLPTTDLEFDAADVREKFVNAVGEAVIFPAKKSKQKNAEEILALPLYIDTLALYYNKTLFQNILAKPYARPEAIWAGIQEDSTKLTIKNSNDPTGFTRAGIALGRTDNIFRGIDLFLNLYLQFGGADLAKAKNEESTDDTGKTYQPLTAALDFFTNFSRNPRQKEFTWNAKLANFPEKELAEFAKGRVAMIAGYSFYLEKIKNLISQFEKQGLPTIKIAEVEIAPLPQLRDPTAYPKTALADFFALTVAKTSANPDASWQLILDLNSRESQQKYHQATGKPSSRRDLITEQKKEPLSGIFSEQAVYARALKITDFEKYFEIIAEVINAVADGKINVQQGINQLVLDIQ